QTKKARSRSAHAPVALVSPGRGPAMRNGLLRRSFLDGSGLGRRSVGGRSVGRGSVGGADGRVGELHRSFPDDGGILGDRLFGGGVAATGGQSEHGGGRDGSQSKLLHDSIS